MRKKSSPSRQRYEAAHPTVTCRLPAELKGKLDLVLQAEALNFSEWVQAQVAGAGAQTTAAYRRGRTKGHKVGEAAGYQRGRAEGEQVAGIAGWRAGILSFAFAAEQGRAYDTGAIAQRLAEQPEQLALAEGLIPADFRTQWDRLMRTARRGGSTHGR